MFEQMSIRGQRLPTEIVLTIFEHVLDMRPWDIQTLSLISKHTRPYLLRRLFQELHLHSMDQLDSLITRRWPSHSSSGLKKDKSDKRKVERHSPSKLALYLHFMHKIEDEECFYDELLNRLERLPKETRIKIETFGVRTLTTSRQYAALGLWTSNLFCNLRRLYVDTSLLPPYGNGLSNEEILSKMEAQPFKTQSRHPNERPNVFHSNPTKLEAYAYAGSSLGAAFGHLEGLSGHRSFINKVFPKLERLYLFTLAWQHDGTDMQEELDMVAADFEEETNVRFIVQIVIQGKEPADWCPIETNIWSYPKGTMVIKNVIIDEPQGGLE